MKTIRVVNNTLTVHFENKLSLFLNFAPPVLTVTKDASKGIVVQLGAIAEEYYQIPPDTSDIGKARYLLAYINKVPVGTKSDMHKVLEAFVSGKIESGVMFTFNDSGQFETPEKSGDYENNLSLN